jgi:hypothetical protein
MIGQLTVVEGLYVMSLIIMVPPQMTMTPLPLASTSDQRLTRPEHFLTDSHLGFHSCGTKYLAELNWALIYNI